jgi:uncharacterized OB-fold protein
MLNQLQRGDEPALLACRRSGFLRRPYVVGQIQMVEGVNLPAPGVGVDPDAVEVGTRVAASLRRMKLGHAGDIYYSYKFVVVE